MLRINKGSQPRSFESWVMIHPDCRNFKKLKGKPKIALKKSLISDQHQLCCYCSSKITECTSHIEHIKPKSRYSDFMFNYANLLASCNGYKMDRDSCGHRKDDWYEEELFISPLDQDCESRFSYLFNGKIIAATSEDAAAAATICHLNLNSYELERARAAIYDAIMMFGDDEESVRREMEKCLSQKAAGTPQPFCNVIVSALTYFLP